MTIFNNSIRSVDSLADEYARSRKIGTTPISTRAAITALRTLLPDSALTDKEIATIIAGKALEHGLSVDFDPT